jgi:hypothetical protein
MARDRAAWFDCWSFLKAPLWKVDGRFGSPISSEKALHIKAIHWALSCDARNFVWVGRILLYPQLPVESERVWIGHGGGRRRVATVSRSRGIWLGYRVGAGWREPALRDHGGALTLRRSFGVFGESTWWGGENQPCKDLAQYVLRLDLNRRAHFTPLPNPNRCSRIPAAHQPSQPGVELASDVEAKRGPIHSDTAGSPLPGGAS